MRKEDVEEQEKRNKRGEEEEEGTEMSKGSISRQNIGDSKSGMMLERCEECV